jgi:microcystin-dependent protein
MADQFVGEIRMFAGNFAPVGWATCDGQILPISQNTALFSLLGTNYGGNGTTNFGLPNLAGSVPIHHGQGPGLTDRVVGEIGGTATVTLIPSETPAHDANTAGPAGAVPAAVDTPPLYRNDTNATMAVNAVAQVGSGLPHNNMQPYLAVTFIIALQGIFPPR